MKRNKIMLIGTISSLGMPPIGFRRTVRGEGRGRNGDREGEGDSSGAGTERKVERYAHKT